MSTTLATTASNDSRLVATDLLQLIGNTPLIRLERIARDFQGVEIFGKAEFFNPGGSVKDRAGLNMIREGERSGKLTHDKILLDATSGNTGIAYAMIGDRFYGTVVAYVPGSKAASYKFTSALAVQIFKDLEPQLRPLFDPRDLKPPVSSLLTKNERPNPGSSIQR